MDKKDKRILVELDKDPLIPLSRLAKKLRISQQVADYRMKRMREDERKLRFVTIINIKSFGLNPYRVFFKFNPFDKYTPEDVFKYLKTEPFVQWATRTGGRYDMILGLAVPGIPDLDEFLDGFNKRFPGLVKDVKSCFVVNHVFYKHKFLHDNPDAIKYGYNEKKVVLDDLDRSILFHIKSDARASSVKIAEANDVSYKTVLNRIETMKKNRVILGSRLFFRDNEVSRFVIICSYKNFSRKKERELVAYLDVNKFVTQSTRLFGKWDLYLNVRSRNNEELQEFIRDLQGRFDIISEYEIIPFFGTATLNIFPV